MSVHINLLPYRDERRRMRQRQFGTQIGLVAALALAIVLLVHMLVSGNIGAQQERNQFLKQELARLDKDIGEIGRLKQEVAALLARKQVIERLQSDRAQAVHLLDQLVRQVPEGVYLRQVKQVGLGINLQGYSQANARVSTLMRNLAESAYLENPVLVEIKSATVNNRRVSEFSMNVSLREQLPSQAKPVTTPAVSAPVSTPGGGQR
jgi:type IV pilus assembly protein PilN